MIITKSIRGIELNENDLHSLRDWLQSDSSKLFFKILRQEEMQCLDNLLAKPNEKEHTYDYYQANHNRVLGQLDSIKSVKSLLSETNSLINEISQDREK